MRPHKYPCIGLLALLLFIAGCARQPEPTQRYDLTGKVVSIDAPASQVVVDHKDIPGFMSAMTMGYPVKDTSALQSLQTGDEITANVVVQGTDMWLENIQVTQKAAAPEAQPEDSSPAEHAH